MLRRITWMPGNECPGTLFGLDLLSGNQSSGRVFANLSRDRRLSRPHPAVAICVAGASLKAIIPLMWVKSIQQ